jgi:hypothetical protein
MSDLALTEEPLQFGQGGRLLGVLTAPRIPPPTSRELPVFLLLNAGSLHRVGPARLHVRLARELAGLGLISLRVDLAGTGDSPARTGLSHQQCIAADCGEIVSTLDSRLGRSSLVLGGLCSAADNAIFLARDEPRIIGMMLLDPVCFPDPGFKARAMAQKYLSPVRYLAALKRRYRALTQPRGDGDGVPVQYWETRNLPAREQLRAAFVAVRQREGRVLSVFTGYARPYYNRVGQLESILGIDGYRQFCTELYWPWAEHTFPLDLHRRRLIEEVKRWAHGFYLRPVTEQHRVDAIPARLEGVGYAS